MPVIVGPARYQSSVLPKFVFPVGLVDIGRQIKVILVQTAEVGDLGEIRPGAGGKLHRQVFEDRLVGHDVHLDVDPGVFGLEALTDVFVDLAFVAVRMST